MSVVVIQERSLAEAVAILVEAIHQAFPAVSTRPLPPYEDEDFALEVSIPYGPGPERGDECVYPPCH